MPKHDWKRGETRQMPRNASLRDALKLAARIGFLVEDVRGTGEVRVRGYGFSFKINARRHDATSAFTTAINARLRELHDAPRE